MSYLLALIAFGFINGRIHDPYLDRKRLIHGLEERQNYTEYFTFSNSTLNDTLNNVNKTKNAIINDDFNHETVLYLTENKIKDKSGNKPTWNITELKYTCIEPVIIHGTSPRIEDRTDPWILLRLCLEASIILTNSIWFIISVYRLKGLKQYLKSRNKRQDSYLSQLLPDYGLQIHSSFLGMTYGIMMTSVDLFLILFSKEFVSKGCLWWKICGLSRKLLECAILVYWIEVCMILLFLNRESRTKPNAFFILLFNAIPYVLSGIVQLCFYLMNKITIELTRKRYDLSYHSISKPPFDCIYELFWNPSSILLNGITNILPTTFIIGLGIKYLFKTRVPFGSGHVLLLMEDSPKVFQPFKMNLYGIMLAGLFFTLTSVCHLCVNIITYQFYDINADLGPIDWLPLNLIRVHLIVQLASLSILPIFMCQTFNIIKNLRNRHLLKAHLDGEKFIREESGFLAN